MAGYDEAVQQTFQRRKSMKKHFCMLLIFISIFALNACSQKTEAPVMRFSKAVPADSHADQKLYVNDNLGFTFAVPDSWENGNYTPQMTDSVITISGKSTKYTAVSFAFQNDKESPLLTILVLPKTWWDLVGKSKDEQVPDYLGTSGDTVYCYTLPQACPYDVGAKADLYNSMVLLHDDIPNRFKILSK
jgi:hypothetical protein